MSTPLMLQYARMKAKHPDTILLFRLGDFYETFEEDAGIASRVLGITLTKRGNGTAGDIPLAGFPYHALDSYLPKLVKAGHRVAICEQLEDPKFAKGIVKRDVTEVVTPGVAFSDKVLDQKQNNYLLAIALPHALATGEETVGVAFVDVTTAEFGVGELPLRQLADQVAALAPSEILVQKRDMESIQAILKSSYSGTYSRIDDWMFDFDYARGVLTSHFKTRTLKGFGIEELSSGVIAAGAIMNYLQETQKSNLDHLRKIVPFSIGDYILLDRSTKRNLEITQSIEGREEGTLFNVLDRTSTPMGGRMLKNWISRPLRTIDPLRARLAAVGELVARDEVCAGIRESLSGIGDLERLVSKISTNRANPREVVALKRMLGQITELLARLEPASCATLADLRQDLQPLDPVVEKISAALSEDPPLSLAEGGVIRTGYNEDLDTLRGITHNGKSWIARLQAEERERTGIPSLKVGFNNVFGYYIEVTNTHKEKVPESFIRKQTLANAERFITPELKEHEEKILNAEERILKLESDLFGELRMLIAEHAGAILRNASLIATLDCYASLADVARDHHYVSPVLSEETRIEIEEGRHPVIERLLPPGDAYTPNDTLLDTGENQVLIITGPNMSGKSSYLRQVGLIVLLAHIGSFVPAKAARIGLVDRIYTRVGASDNIASGESTFLVEMHEAANILNTATSKSLILLDEVGRGTSTFDGISIAWALTEYIHDRIGAKTLFATHYHELNELAGLFPRIKNLKVEVREYEDRVIFLHKVTPGFADHSYGIQVAQMAGLPAEVTERAKDILRNLEGSDLNVHTQARPGSAAKGRIAPPEIQMTLFDGNDKLREDLQKLDIDGMTPLDALKKLAELKQKHKS
jgi:DNA mismatch repair protein MutS